MTYCIFLYVTWTRHAQKINHWRFVFIYTIISALIAWQMVGLFSIAVKLSFRIDWSSVRVCYQNANCCGNVWNLRCKHVFFLVWTNVPLHLPRKHDFFARQQHFARQQPGGRLNKPSNVVYDIVYDVVYDIVYFHDIIWGLWNDGGEHLWTGYVCPTLSQVLDLCFLVCTPFCVTTSPSHNTCNTPCRSHPDWLFTAVSTPFWGQSASTAPS